VWQRTLTGNVNTLREKTLLYLRKLCPAEDAPPERVAWQLEAALAHAVYRADGAVEVHTARMP
jgi:hypothetical protein